MLLIEAAPGLVYVNGRFVGEAGGPVTPLVRDGICHIEYKQFDRWGTDIAFRLVMKGGLLVDGLPRDVYAVQWPSGLLEVEIHTQEDETAQPATIQSLHTPFGMLLIMERGDSLFVGFEDMPATELPAIGPFTEINVRTQPHPTMPLVVISGNGEDGPFSLLVRLDNPPLLIQTGFGYGPSGNRLKSEFTSASETAKAWLEATHEGATDRAAELLLYPMYQNRYAQLVGAFEQIVTLKTPVQGLAPVEWGVLQLITPQIAHIKAVGFVLSETENGWKIEQVIM
ncbi:MAG: hypothetical protein LBD16_02575 [Oscillospiraceae bacterium]|jgi:hypothetical protein|nr:hypothetical protein [Oscillospiraceae bacterium]